MQSRQRNNLRKISALQKALKQVGQALLTLQLVVGKFWHFRLSLVA